MKKIIYVLFLMISSNSFAYDGLCDRDEIKLYAPDRAMFFCHTTAGLDLDRYCKSHRGPDSEAILVDWSVNGWRCITHGQIAPISIVNACREQHRTSIVTYTDFYDPYSWLCVDPVGKK